MSYEKQVWSKYDDLKPEEENIENGAVLTDSRMNHMEEGIESNDNNFTAHSVDTNNPHKVTATQVGLGNVQNFGLSTVDEAKQGDSNAKYMTPSLTQAALSANINSVAYAYSADGTDGFSTTYPNLNLGDNTKLFTGANGGNGLTGSVRIDPNTVISKDGNFNSLTFKPTRDNTDWFRFYLLPNPGTPNMTKVPIIPNANYTFSAYLKGSGTHRIYGYANWTVPNPVILSVTLTDQWKLYTFTVKSSATLPSSDAQFFIRSDSGTEISLKKPKIELGSIATPWMPSASEATNADYPTFIGYSNTVKTNKVASDYTWFPVKDSELTNKVDSHVNNKSNPHAVTASQVGSYTKSEVAALISSAITQSKLDANPVGSIITTINDINPSNYLGGTWERFAQGRTLVGVDENDTDFNQAGKTGGEKTHVLDVSSNRGKNEAGFTSTSREGLTGYGLAQASAFSNRPAVMLDSGNNWQPQGHNNMQPFMTVYFWRRTA